MLPMLFAADVYEFGFSNGQHFSCDPSAGILQIPFIHVGRTLIAIDSSQPTSEEWRELAAEAWLKIEGYSRLAILRQLGQEDVAKHTEACTRAMIDPAPPQLSLGEFIHINQRAGPDGSTPYEGRDFYFNNRAQSWVIAVKPISPRAQPSSKAG